MNSRFILTAALPFLVLLFAAGLVIFYQSKGAPTTQVVLIPAAKPVPVGAIASAAPPAPIPARKADLPPVPAPMPEAPPAVTPIPDPKTVEMTVGQMDVEVLSIPSDQREAFMTVWQGTPVASLADVLGKFSNTVEFSASTSLGARRGESVKASLTISPTETLTYAAEATISHQFLLEGDFAQVAFTKLFESDAYQMVLTTGDEPSPAGGAASNFKAVLMRIHHVSTAEVAPHPEAIVHEIVPPAPPPVPVTPGPWPPGFKGGLSPLTPPVANEDTPAPPPPTAPGPGTMLYRNPGDNVTDFVQKFGEGVLTVDHHTLLGAMGNGWMSLPVTVTGDFKVECDAYGDSNDVGFFLVLFDGKTTRGINVVDCPEGTVTSTNSIHSAADLTNTMQFLFDSNPLATTRSAQFKNRTWTHLTLTRKGQKLINDVGGQTITGDLSNQGLPKELQVGLGFWAMTNVGGNGKARYANIQIVQLSQRRKHRQEEQ